MMIFNFLLVLLEFNSKKKEFLTFLTKEINYDEINRFE